MEYYILKIYEKEKKKHNLKLGYNRFSKKEKIVVYSMFIIMIVSFAISVMVQLFFHTQYLHLLGFVPTLTALFVIFRVDKTNEKNARNANIEEHIKKINLLYGVLKKKEINITTKSQIEALIHKYNKYINDRENRNQRKSKIIITMSSILITVLTVTFQSLKDTGMPLMDWIYFAIVLSIVFFTVGVLIYISKYFDILKYNYKKMVDDLDDLLILKF